MAQIEVQWVQEVQEVQIRPIRPIRGRNLPVLWRTALQAEYHVGDYPGTPPPSVYQVTQSTALQAAERYVKQRVL